MKKSLILALFLTTGMFASAQWVTIPDENFADALNEFYPFCMNGNQLDISCPAVTNENLLDVSNREIADLTGVQYFTNLHGLWCYSNELTFLPELPNSLGVLICYGNNLTELPELPNLTGLICSYNDLTELPQLPLTLIDMVCTSNEITELPELPGSLTGLNCAGNALTALPDLPNSLSSLKCNDNELTNLPQLPNSLNSLYCWNNFLTILPQLPSSLISLRCWNNNLIQIPALPSSLTDLRCYQNDLSELPELPHSLGVLDCRGNYLTELPLLPDSLTELDCGRNLFTELPGLPITLEKLFCDSNQLACLPLLPVSLEQNSISYDFNISNNPFTCVPNYVPAMSGNDNSVWLSYPLCELSDLDNNPYGCSGLEGITGIIFEDENTNCEKEAEEAGLVNIPLKLLDYQDNLLASATTLSNHVYNFVADTGNYTVQLVVENMPFQVSCDAPGETQYMELTGTEPSAFHVDFGVECLPGFDIGVQSVVTTGWVFPGQLHTLKIAAGDMTNWYGLQCAQNVSGIVTVDVDGPVNYVGPDDGALSPSVSGDLQFTYDIADFSMVNFQQDFALLLETDTTAQAGDQICLFISVDPLNGDVNSENNNLHHCYEVVNSYDPNIKQVWPQDVAPEYDGYFNYTIYFQNTGTAPAFNIRVADTLDTNLDLSTFEVTGYSHPCLTYVSSNVATFRFNNIMLPDSTSDFDGSIGYVQYRIKAVEDLPVGTIIENTAHIYFDFNDAIVTNTTQNEFVIDTGVDQPQQQLATVFPNPGTGQFNVLLSGAKTGITNLEVYNLSGQRVLQRQVNENRVMLDLTDYPSGMYLLHVRNEQGSEAVRIVKH